MENEKQSKSYFIKTKKHSKSDAFALDLNNSDDNGFNNSKSYQDTMNKLAKKNNELTKSLQKALEKNKELKAELKRKLELKAKLEDQKNTTKELQLLTSLCNTELVEASK